MKSSPALCPADGRVLHIVHDEKFIDAARAIFEEVAPGSHDFLIIGAPVPLRRIRTFQPAWLTLDAVLRRSFLASLPRYDAVIVHYLGDAARLVVDAAPPATCFVWLAWGADYYHLMRSNRDLLLCQTRALVDELAPSPAAEAAASSMLQHLLGLVRAAGAPLQATRRVRVRQARRRVGHHGPGELAMLNRFSRMATPIEEDHAALHAGQPALRIPFLDWNYWTEGFRADAAGPGPTGNDLLLGNSATPANNHLEAIEFLARVLPANRRVFCPLSYGDVRYGDAVEAAGRRMLGDRFVPLRHFMEPEAYSRLIASCSIIVMNHARQQALGNIILGLCAGAQVFLHADSPIRPAMRRLGIEVPSLEELPAVLQQAGPTVPANLGELRRKLEGRFGRESIVRRTRELLDQLRLRREAFNTGVELPA